MRFLLILCFFCYCKSYAQNDLLVLKKNNKTIQSFYPGSALNFSTANGNFSTYITGVQKDSIYVVQYDIRTVPTNLGVYMLDTVARYNFGINYRDIISLGKMNNHFDWSASGGALFGGGLLITTVGLGTWIFTKPNSKYYASPYLVGGAALLAGIGYLMAHKSAAGFVIGKKYKLEYISLSNKK
ncbi:MAG: hypothetical protein JSS98_14085 [Bacteroidetes bacterium]|nr:hypothetical protein [Bacteroidota bacterium]